MLSLLKNQNNLDVFYPYDSCIHEFTKTVQQECRLCPLSDDSIDKILELMYKVGRLNYYSYCYSNPLRVAARQSFKDASRYVICFNCESYPVARSQREISTEGFPEFQLYTDKSFEYFFKKSVCTMQREMAIQDLLRFLRLIISKKLVKLA